MYFVTRQCNCSDIFTVLMVRMKLVSVLKSTISGKLLHMLTIRSLKNLAQVVEEECF